MKNLFIKLISLMLCLFILLSTIVSCGTSSEDDEDDEIDKDYEDDENLEDEDEYEEEKDFEDLNEKEKALYILKAEESTENGRVDTTMNYECEYYGEKITVEITQSYTVTQKDGKYEDHTEMRIVTTAKEMSTVVLMTQGYRDGKMYARMITDGVVGQSEVTKMTQDEYLEKLAESLEDIPENFGINEDTCDDFSCEQKENGDWVATFCDLDKDCLSYFETLAQGYFGSLLMNDIKDVTMVLTATEEFLPKTIEIEYEFSGTNKPTFKIFGEYDLSEDIELPEIDWSQFDDTSDKVPSPPSSDV